MCSSYCRATPTCKAWTWLTSAFPQAWGKKKCHLKTSDTGRKTLSDAISGIRKCGETGKVI